MDTVTPCRFSDFRDPLDLEFHSFVAKPQVPLQERNVRLHSGQRYEDMNTEIMDIDTPQNMVDPVPVPSGMVRSSTVEWQGLDSMQDILSFGSDESFNLDSDEEDENQDLQTVDAIDSSGGRFNIELLCQYIEKGQHTLDMIEGKDVCLVIGKTGSGKSTLIQGFAGKTFRAVKRVVQVKGRDLIKTVYEPDDPLEGFEIGHEKISKTRSINCFKHRSSNNQIIYFVDSPGFEDTGGHEIDTSTSVLLREVAQRSKSLRFIIVISFTSLMDSRGQPMRGLLKLINSFVKDFNENRKSFMFLFSQIPPTLDQDVTSPYDRLRREVEDILKGSTDDDVKVVLQFLRKSLQEKYPFTQIFSPASTDFSRMLRFVKSGLKPIHQYDGFGTQQCGLTVSSHLKLDSEVSRALLEVKSLLEGHSHKGSKRVNEIVDTLTLLHKFIGSSRIKIGLAECQKCIDTFCDTCKQIVDQKISQGTMEKWAFGAEDIAKLKNSSRCLCDLTGQKEETFEDRVATQVSRFGISTLDYLAQGRWRAVSDCLQKLKAWADGFPGSCRTHYDNVRSAVEEKIKHLVEQADNILHLDIGSAEIVDIVDMCSVLHDLSACQCHFDDFAPRSIDGDRVVSVQDTIFTKLKTSILTWQDEISNKMHLDRYALKELDDLSRLARILQTLRLHLGQDPVWVSLRSGIDSCYEDIKCTVLRYYGNCAFQWTSTKQPLNDKAYGHINDLLEGAKYFADMGNEWQPVEISSNSILAIIRNLLSDKAKFIESISLNAKAEEIFNAEVASQAILDFKGLIEYDKLFDETEQFLHNVFTTLQRNICDRMNQNRKHIDSHYNDLLNEKQDSMMALTKFKQCAADVKDTATLAHAVEETKLCDLQDYMNSKLIIYLEKMQRRCDTSISRCQEAVNTSSKQSCLLEETEKLNDLLGQMAIIDAMKLGETVDVKAKTISDKIEGNVRSFCATVESELSEPSDFKLIAFHLSVMQELKYFIYIGPLIPTFDSLKAKARAMVSKLAEKVEKMVEESANWDDIDNLIGELDHARVVDEFVDSQVSSRLGPLRKLREKKEGDVESEVAALIEREDFQGIGSLIGPLANSTNQLKQQRFCKYEGQILSAVDEQKRFIKASLNANSILNIDTMKKIAKGISVLRAVDREIGLQVKRDLKKDINDVINAVNKRFETYFTNFDGAQRSLDVTRMAISKSSASEFASYLAEEAPAVAKEKVQTMETIYDEYVQSGEVEVNAFFECGFRNGDKLSKLLTSLERGSNSDHPATSDLVDTYGHLSQLMQAYLLTALEDIQNDVSERQSFEDGVANLQLIVSALDGGLSQHINIEKLPYNCQVKLQEWREATEKVDGSLDFVGENAEDNITALAHLLDGLQKKQERPIERLWRSVFGGQRTYDNHLHRIRQKLTQIESFAERCLRTTETAGLQRSVVTLRLLDQHIRKHVPEVQEVIQRTEQKTTSRFDDILNTAVTSLKNGDWGAFEIVFAYIRRLVLDVPLVLEQDDLAAHFRLVNELILDFFRGRVHSMMAMIELKSADMDFTSVDFLAVRAAIEETRAVGDFVADHCTLFYAEMLAAAHLEEDPSLAAIMGICRQHFSDGRNNFKNMPHCAILGVVPSADEKEIRRAYKAKALAYHPDKSGRSISGTFPKVKEAEEALLDGLRCNSGTLKRAFDQEIRQMRTHIVTKTKRYMQEQRYDAIDHILSHVAHLREIKDLVDPQFDDIATRNEVHMLVKDHVQKVKTEVNTLWSERKYRDLNDTIDDLKAMEASLKCHSDVFPASWNEGILQDIEGETKKLAMECRKYLVSQSFARENESEFRREFLRLGCILVEIPSMKNSTKAIMSDLLEYCIREEWGFGYLFELGLSLQRGDDTNNETDHVAHLILAEFSHFKEILTMAWNTETVQKPVQDTVKYIQAQSLKPPAVDLKINEGALLASFEEFEIEYNMALGEYLRPACDRAALVRRVIDKCKKLRTRCRVDRWGLEIREAMPKILGGIFALFTICKSGESFNRIVASNPSSKLGEQVLMKPHNIQVLSLLYMFGCHEQSGNSLESQLLQIRTGEGKSMILGAAATVLGLLGFRVRCVCYSDYLSQRDYESFFPVFREFGLDESIVYLKITKLSEEMVSRKGDIRSLTTDLLLKRLEKDPATIETAKRSERQNGGLTNLAPNLTSELDSLTLENSRNRARPRTEKNQTVVESSGNGNGKRSNLASLVPGNRDLQDSADADTQALSKERNQHGLSKARIQEIDISEEFSEMEEILLLDEVDVFFGSEFYGQTYNQVTQIREPEVRHILELIWSSHKQAGRRLHLSDIKKTDAYLSLITKMQGFAYVVDKEISLMLEAVRHVDDESYFLGSQDRIGYKVLDTISYDVTMGYRTVFAYLQENDRRKLRDPCGTLSKALCMQVSCGQFSYANISPSRILGVSGTLSAMGTYHKSVLQKYGISKFVFLPSVYGSSNFRFDKAGDGVYIESNQSDQYQRLQQEISRSTSANRAVIIFFAGESELLAFKNSPYFRQLGRKRAVLCEDMDSAMKDFIIKKASTARQVTICSAVFGRGTDFFCKDQKVEDNGGVHVIQTFFSTERSEEVQIQGRTARQGKAGSYQLILLESDLRSRFGISPGFKDNFPKKDWYKELCRIRDSAAAAHSCVLENDLSEAGSRDKLTHEFFDALLAHDRFRASKIFKKVYSLMKKTGMPSSIDIDVSFVVDVTGSMCRYMKANTDTIECLLSGNRSIVTRLRSAFPEIDEFKLHIGVMAFRDLEDGGNQFHEKIFTNGTHFTENSKEALRAISDLTKDPSGGYDIAEDILGAIHRCASWPSWSSMIKLIILVTDAPTHGLVGRGYLGNMDKFPHAHQNGCTVASTVDVLIQNSIDLAFCSFNPPATERTEEALAELYLKHEGNPRQREIIRIPMIATHQEGASPFSGDRSQHIIFVLDYSGSMKHNWAGVEAAYGMFCGHRLDRQCSSDLVSVVQFDDDAVVAFQQESICTSTRSLPYRGGGTQYTPAAQKAARLVLDTPISHEPVVVFMSDGYADETDAKDTAQIFSNLNVQVRRRWGMDLELHVVAFGSGLDKRQLTNIMQSSTRGRIHASANVTQLGHIFVEIAKASSDVGTTLESEISRLISEAVSDKIALEYFG